MREQGTRLKDVAKVAGVSISTASKAINDETVVAESTRKRVLNVAKRLGYRASLIPKSLRSRNSKAIGLLLPDIVNPFFCTLANAAGDVALKQDYVIILGSIKGNIERESLYFDIFAERWIDGIILAGGASEDEKYIQYIKEERIPIVFIREFLLNLHKFLRSQANLG